MRLKASLAISLLVSVLFIFPMPASGASPSGLGQFELGMDYDRVKELLSRKGYRVLLGVPDSLLEMDMRDQALLTPEGYYKDYRVLIFAFPSEFGWPRDQSANLLAFGGAGQELKGVQVVLFAMSKKASRKLRAIEAELDADLDSKFERVSDPVSAPDGDGVFVVRRWVRSDGRGGSLRVLSYHEGEKQTSVTLLIGEFPEELEADWELPEGIEVGDKAETTVESESTQAQAPIIVLSQAGQEREPEDSALTNEDVVRLAASEMGDDLIVQLIESNSVNFTVNPDALVELKKSGLSDRVIAAMLSRAKGGQ
ncbi:MAG: hypothetical protein WBG64_14270 [Thermoanaerobaculia bacterium]